MRTLLIVSSLIIAGCSLLSGCNGKDASDDSSDAVKCPPYDGSDTETIHVVKWKPNIGKDRETYFTFYYEASDPLNPRCTSLDYQMLCACDVASTEVMLPVECGDGLTEDVTEVVFKQGTIREPGTDCPERD